jgi:glycosyltransferase involved in cell wall biosynthesis
MMLSVIIPVYNEKNTILKTLSAVQKADIPLTKEIIIVNDCSTDGTREILDTISDKNVKVFHLHKNVGKGAAIKAAIEHLTGDITIIQDADLEYSPDDFPHLLQPILSGNADVVFGSRFLGGGTHRVHLFWHSLGNHALTLLSNIFTNLNLTDMEVGYKAFKTEILKKIDIKQKRFGFEPEITAKAAKLKCRVYEVPISYYGRTYAEGKKITWKDAIQAFYCILRYGLFN